MPSLIRALASAGRSSQSTVGQFVHPYSMGRPLLPDFDVSKAFVDGYHANSWVRSCVSMRARLVKKVPWIVRERHGEKWEPVPGGHEKGVLIEAPSDRLSREIMMTLASQHLDLNGNFLWKKVMVGKRVDELWPLNPGVMKPVADKGEWISRYERTDGLREEPEPAEAVIHGLDIDGGNPLWGSPPFRSIRGVVAMDRDQVDWNRSTVRNLGVPPGALVDPNLTDPKEIGDVREELRQRFDDPSKARQPMLLTGGASWVPFGMSPVDMDWDKGQRFSVYRICAVYNVPVIILLPDHSSYNNLDTAITYLWNHAAVPQLDVIRDALNLHLFPTRAERSKFFIDYDLSGVEALKKKLKDELEALGKGVENGIVLNEMISLLELPLGPQPGGDVPRYRSALVEWREEGTEEADAKLDVAAA